MTIEPILAAAWAIASADSGWRTQSRTLRMWDEVDAVNMPALFQALEAVTPANLASGTDASWTIRIVYSIYVATQSENERDPTLPAQAILAQRINVLTAAFAGDTLGRPVTLGGLVYSARIEGDIEIFEGTLGPIAVAFVPVTLVVG